MKAMLALLLALTLSCSSAQVQQTKAHAVEVVFAGAGGAGWVLVAGPAGPFIFLGLSVIGVLLNEKLQPPDPVTVVTFGPDGKKKVEHFQPKERNGQPPQTTSFFGGIVDLLTSIVRWIAYVALGWWAYKFFWPRYRSLAFGALGNLLCGRLPTAIKEAHKASGMLHSRDTGDA